MTISTAVSGNVRGIESQDGVVYLLVGERAIALNSVINASIPKEAAADTTNTDTDTETTES